MNMKKQQVKISDTELVIMNLIWQSPAPISSVALFEKLETGWKYPTVTTLLGRLTEKGAVIYEKRGKAYYYTAALDEAAYRAAETKDFVGKMHGGSMKSMIAALYESNDLTSEDIDELRHLFELN